MRSLYNSTSLIYNYSIKESFFSIRASDTLWVRPGAEGDWNQIELEDETEVGFEIEMYNGN